jgi:glycosyltransferase involved in cell wall biosynthesis
MPVYDEAEQLEPSIDRLLPALEALGRPFEVVLVDDGSRDATPAIVDRLAARDARVRAVHHATNRGVAAGIATAIREARGAFFILIPADLAMEPEDLQAYVAASGNADIVAGYTGPRSDYTAYRRLVSWLNGTLLRTLFGMPIRNFNYIHLYRLSLLRAVRPELTGSAIMYAEIFVKAKLRGARIVQVPVRYRPRAAGRATGARLSLILRTGRDMVRLWLRYVSGRLSPRGSP